MTSARNPTRRNRNIGTSKSGLGQDNRLVIPNRWWRGGRFYTEELSPCIELVRTIGTHSLTFFVQQTRPGWFYPCTVDDICRVLGHLPPEDIAPIRFIVLRQPTRKQQILEPIWGRAVFHFEPDGQRHGPAIILEAQQLRAFKWGRSMSPDRRREFERLQQDGHRVVGTTSRFYILQPDAESLRRTHLYRTLLHEVGHHVDYASWDGDAWDGRSTLNKEDFAHRYAAEAYVQLSRVGVVPFVRLFDAEEMTREGLLPEDFLLPDADGGL